MDSTVFLQILGYAGFWFTYPGYTDQALKKVFIVKQWDGYSDYSSPRLVYNHNNRPIDLFLAFLICQLF